MFTDFLKRKTAGFTLAELLIALAILGVIATFTIPKVLSSQQNTQYNAAAKEMAAAVSAAYQSYKISNTPTNNFGIKDLTPYLNYVRISTMSSDLLDLGYTQTSADCNSFTAECLYLHNGGALIYWNQDSFGSVTSTTSGVIFGFDPDGKYGGTTNGPGKAIAFYLYTNGSVKDVGNIPNNTQYYNGTVVTGGPCPACVPPWFSWN